MRRVVGVIVLLIATFTAVTLEAEAAKRKVNPDAFLVQFGYMGKVPEGGQQDVAVRRKAIRTFQRFAGLRVTGRMNRATLRKMAAPRCGRPDIEPAAQAMTAQNYEHAGYKWRKNQLSWRVWSTTPDMTRKSQFESFRRAFKYWEDASGLEFEEKRSGDADINIRFAKGQHGDGAVNAFDGQGRVLAHAFYPENGQAHFDLDESWSDDADPSHINLEVVAAHEFGHILGLGHSSVHNALMAPYYQGYTPNYKLPEDDVKGITSIYGKPRQSASPGGGDGGRGGAGGSTGGGSGTGGNNDPCTMSYDAVFSVLGRHIYVISGPSIWKLNTWTALPGFPVKTTKYFSRLPSRIGASVIYENRGDRLLFFFAGTDIYKYQGTRLVSKSSIRGTNMPTDPQAAFQSRDGKVYVLQGGDYWEFDTKRNLYVGGKRSISGKWPNLPSNVDSTLVLQGFLYAIKGNKYWKYDENGGRVMPGYPKEVAPAFLGPKCGGKYVPK